MVYNELERQGFAIQEPEVAEQQSGEDPIDPIALGDQHRSLNDMVTAAVRNAITEGRFRPGERLVEDRLARLFGVSRNPVREALKILRSEGLVEITPRRGASVAALSPEEAREVIELRAALEGLSARLAARRCTPEVAARLAAILDAGDAAVARREPGTLKRLNDEFHTALARAGSNRYLSEFMTALRAKTYWLFSSISETKALESWTAHASILRAVLDRDEELASLLASRHVTTVGNHLAGGPPADGAAIDVADEAFEDSAA
ncbi:MAG: GntR family transcriptional regulator [Alphaproteobacteria bacterium]